MLKKGAPAILMMILLSVLFTPPATACWLCKLADGLLACDLVIGESGGSSCTTNCKSNGVCYCRNLGICGGTNQCDGSPCPTVHPRAGATSGETVWLTRNFLAQVEAASPEAGVLLTSLTRDPDLLQVGLRDRVAIEIGESRGMFMLPAPKGQKPLAYRFEASVTALTGGVAVHIKVFDHPTLQALDAEIWSDASGSRVDLEGRSGRLQRIEP
ncbi:MAG: hypothetical protein ACJ75H_18575 [Thermoanaerobaculia bacterium]